MIDRRAVVSGVLVAVIVIAWIVFGRAEPSLTDGVSAPPEVRQDRSGPVAASVPDHLGVTRVMASPSTAVGGVAIIKAQDNANRPVEGAIADLAERAATTYGSGELVRLGQTDSTGTISVQVRPGAQGSTPSVLLRKDGFANAIIDRIESGRTYEVTLVPALRLTVKVLDATGTPVSGAIAIAYEASASLDSFRWFEGECPVSAFRDSCRSAVLRTNDAGDADFRLPLACYSLAVFGDGMVMGGVPKSADLASESPCYREVHMAQLLGAVLDVVDVNGRPAKVLGHKTSVEAVGFRRATNMFSLMQQGQVRDKLIASCGSKENCGARIAVLAAVAPMDPAGERRVRASVNALVDGVGYVTWEGSLDPLAMMRPIEIRAAKPGYDIGAVSIGAPPQLSEFIGRAFMLQAKKVEPNSGHVSEFRIATGEPYHVAAGYYGIICMTDRREVLRLTVQAGKTTHVDLANADLGSNLWISLALDGGQKPYGCRVAIKPVGGADVSYHNPYDPSFLLLPLPPGEYAVSTVYGAVTKQFPLVRVSGTLTRVTLDISL